MFQRKICNNIFIVKFKDFAPGVNIVEFRSDKKKLRFPKKIKIYMNNWNYNILVGVMFFWEGFKFGGFKFFDP